MDVKIRTESDLDRMTHINVLAMYAIIEENFRLLIETGVMNSSRKIVKKADEDLILETIFDAAVKLDSMYKNVVGSEKELEKISKIDILHENPNKIKSIIYTAITVIKFSTLATMVGLTQKDQKISEIIKQMTSQAVKSISVFGICLEKQHQQIIVYEASLIFSADDILSAVEVVLSRDKTDTVTIRKDNIGKFRLFVQEKDGVKYSYPEKTISQFEICLYDQENFDKMTPDKLSFIEKANQERYGANRKYVMM